jgi:predicted nucleic acid-binding protein
MSSSEVAQDDWNVIVDANIVVKWFVAEDDSDAALALRLQGELFAPDVMLIEYRNALLNKVRRQAISLNEARRAEREIGSVGVTILPSAPLLSRAFQLALDLREPIYDCIYLAAAIATDRIFVTADERFAAKVRKSDGPADRIKLLTGLRT